MDERSCRRWLSSAVLCCAGAASLPQPIFGQAPDESTAPHRASPGGIPAGSNPPQELMLQDHSSWWDWWALHEDRYLRLPEWFQAMVTTDEIWTLLGDDPGQAFRGPTPRQVQLEVVPAVMDVWYTARDPLLTAAALEALGCLGWRDVRGLHHVMQASLTAPQRGVAEAAALGLASLSAPESVTGILLPLVENRESGRRLMAGTSVPEPVCAFAVYGLATAGARSPDLLLQHQVLRSLCHTLAERGAAQDDARVAAAVGLGLQPLANAQRAEFVLEALIAQRDLPLASDRLCAHLNVSIGRIGAACATSAPALRERALAVLLDPRSASGAGARRGTVIALGLLARPEDPRATDIARALTAWSEGGADANCRHLALISLAYLAAADPAAEAQASYPITRLLLTRLRDGHGEDSAWCALALGVMGSSFRARGDFVSSIVTEELLWTFEGTKSPECASACAMALGLLSDQYAAPAVRERMERAGSPAVLRAGSIALGLMNVREQAPYLRHLMAASAQDAETLRAAAIGLTLMQDEQAVPLLLGQLRQQEGSSSAGAIAAACTALAAIGDSRAIRPLLEVVRNPSASAQDRSAAILALGCICGGGQARWNAALRHDAEYFSATETLRAALDASR